MAQQVHGVAAQADAQRRGSARPPWGGVWALGGRDLFRVDPDANRVAARIRIPRSAAFYGAGMVPGAGALWVGAGERTVRVDTRTGRVAGSVRIEVQAAAADGL